MVEKDMSISAFFLHQIPVPSMFIQHLIKTEIEAAEIQTFRTRESQPKPYCC